MGTGGISAGLAKAVGVTSNAAAENLHSFDEVDDEESSGRSSSSPISSIGSGSDREGRDDSNRDEADHSDDDVALDVAVAENSHEHNASKGASANAEVGNQRNSRAIDNDTMS